MLKPGDCMAIVPPSMAGRFLPVDVMPRHPHVVMLAPEKLTGTPAEIISGAAGKTAVGLFIVDRGEVAATFYARDLLLKAYLAAGCPVAFCCQSRQDKAEARRRLAAIAPPTYTVRD